MILTFLKSSNLLYSNESSLITVIDKWINYDNKREQYKQNLYNIINWQLVSNKNKYDVNNYIVYIYLYY